MEEILVSHLGKGATNLLFEMGETYGKALAVDYRSASEDPELLSAFFDHLGTTAGWGRTSTVPSGSKITVKVENCVFCSGDRSPGQLESCHFLRGVCKGIADTVFDWPHFVRESKCVTRGQNACQFVLVKETSREKKGGDWPNPQGTP